MQRALRDKCKKLVVIDELGNKKLDCNAIINFGLCEEWLSSYSCPETVRKFFGPAYYPLREEFVIARERKKKCPKPKVLISLGGADRTRTTLFLAELLSEIDKFEFTYVIGPGFDFGKDEVFKRTKGKTNHKVVQCPENLAQLMAQHSLIFSFGGNT
jgi:spore coat polysaccharide biosynthesis predicted glycosyltransferase SpsG